MDLLGRAQIVPGATRSADSRGRSQSNRGSTNEFAAALGSPSARLARCPEARLQSERCPLDMARTIGAVGGWVRGDERSGV